MEFYLYFYSQINSDDIFELIRKTISIINLQAVVNEDTISSYPIQISFSDEEQLQSDKKYILDEFGMKITHSMIIYIFAAEYLKGTDIMFRLINMLNKEINITNLYLEDPCGGCVIRKQS